MCKVGDSRGWVSKTVMFWYLIRMCVSLCLSMQAHMDVWWPRYALSQARCRDLRCWEQGGKQQRNMKQLCCVCVVARGATQLYLTSNYDTECAIDVLYASPSHQTHTLRTGSGG